MLTTEKTILIWAKLLQRRRYRPANANAIQSASVTLYIYQSLTASVGEL